MKTLIVGMGEVGKGLYGVLSKKYDCISKDVEDIPVEDIDFMHICFPYSDGFGDEIKRLKVLYKPGYIVIHSTVPVGTTKQYGDFFSPVVGKHPNLEESIRTFKKGIATTGKYNIKIIEKYLNNAGIKTERYSSTDSLEFSKIMCTTRYGVDICFMKMIEKICNERGYKFEEVYTNWTNNYNNGYVEMGCGLYWRPVLIPMKGKIGGHCVVPNTRFEDNIATEFIKLFNDSID